ncbi:VOC family protein [Paenibacillus sepulcri]|uniref:VOC family protein n=1 Tax=Paenibacillus sepulcri TaxID=359917 RepID=A0ABS7CBV8_9BACL|nr:VOC family protein [Paenibacillus sepulcri]
MEHIENNNLLKVGIVVDDIEKALKAYCGLFGLAMPEIQTPDPNSVQEHTDNSYTWYRGEYITARTKFANLQMGPVTVELMEPFDEPNPWNEFKQKHGPGVHFITFTVNGFQQHINFLEGQGIPLAHKGEYGSGRYGYFDTESLLGVVLGLQELGPKQD